MKVKIKKLHEDAIIPKYAHLGDSGFDLHALEETYVKAGETKLIKTGLSFSVSEGYELQIRPRSGMSLKTPLRVANAPGTVDSSFVGEVCVIMSNLGYHDREDGLFGIQLGNSFQIKKGDRIAQGVICPVIRAEFEVVEELEETSRGSGGFGSTGK
jgi:dUTP pyrophosphatase